jgi:hypothetical protein
LHHWGWLENSAGGAVLIRAPAEAPLVNAPAAHGLQSPSMTSVNQNIGLAIMVIVAETLRQVFHHFQECSSCSLN